MTRPLFEIRRRWRDLERSSETDKVRVSLLSTFTIDPLVPYFGTALFDYGLPVDFQVAPFNRIAQEFLDGASATSRFRPEVVVVCPRFEDLWTENPLVEPVTPYIDGLVRLAEICVQGARSLQCLLVFSLPPLPDISPLGLGDASNANGVTAVANRAREVVRTRLSGETGVLVDDFELVLRQVGTVGGENYSLSAVARIPFTEVVFAAWGRRLARLIRLTRRPACKVLVVDADGTLWGGAVGEEGANGVDLGVNGPGDAFRSFQRFLLDVRRAGVLLALCSKNEEADVWTVFARDDMVLKREHLTASRVNWRPKSENIESIAEELGLGLDSFVVIDDNPAEVGEIRSAIPQVCCIQMPADVARWPDMIRDAAELDRLPPTRDDLRRSSQYMENRARDSLRAAATSVADYLQQLEVRAHIFEPQAQHMARLAQLVAKTNQFNLNCRRRSEPELAALCRQSSYLVRMVEVADRFGEYGVVGVVIVKIRDNGAQLDTFLLSCRALGRDVETAMLFAAQDAVRMSSVEGGLFVTLEVCPRNAPVREFFHKLGLEQLNVAMVAPDVEWPTHIAKIEGKSV